MEQPHITTADDDELEVADWIDQQAKQQQHEVAQPSDGNKRSMTLR